MAAPPRGRKAAASTKSAMNVHHEKKCEPLSEMKDFCGFFIGKTYSSYLIINLVYCLVTHTTFIGLLN
jgi:hypothetical protein